MTDASELRLHRIYWGWFPQKLTLHGAAPSSSLSGPSLAVRTKGPLESSLLSFEPWKWRESKTNYILKQFRELNVYFWRGRIRAAAGDKTCLGDWACSASLRNPQKFQKMHHFSKVLVDTTEEEQKRKGDFQELKREISSDGEGTGEMTEERINR